MYFSSKFILNEKNPFCGWTTPSGYRIFLVALCVLYVVSVLLMVLRTGSHHTYTVFAWHTHITSRAANTDSYHLSLHTLNSFFSDIHKFLQAYNGQLRGSRIFLMHSKMRRFWPLRNALSISSAPSRIHHIIHSHNIVLKSIIYIETS